MSAEAEGDQTKAQDTKSYSKIDACLKDFCLAPLSLSSIASYRPLLPIAFSLLAIISVQLPLLSFFRIELKLD